MPTTLVYTPLALEAFNGTNINFTSDTIKVALVNGYVPNQSTDQYFSNVTNEVTGTGYTAGGNTLAGKTNTQDNTNKRAIFNASTISWPTSTIAATGAVIYKSTGTSSTSPLIAYVDFNGTLSTANSTFSVAWNATGILAVTVV